MYRLLYLQILIFVRGCGFLNLHLQIYGSTRFLRVHGFADSQIAFFHTSSQSTILDFACFSFSWRELPAFSTAMTKVLLMKNAGNARYVSGGRNIIHSNVSRELILSSFCIPSNYHRNDAYRVATCRMQTPTTSLSCIHMCIGYSDSC